MLHLQSPPHRAARCACGGEAEAASVDTVDSVDTVESVESVESESVDTVESVDCIHPKPTKARVMSSTSDG